MVLYGQFVLLFEIIPSVDSTGGAVWAVCVVVVFVFVILALLAKHELLVIFAQFCCTFVSLVKIGLANAVMLLVSLN